MSLTADNIDALTELKKEILRSLSETLDSADDIDDAVDKLTQGQSTHLSALDRMTVDTEKAKIWLDNELQKIGYLGPYFTETSYFPLRCFLAISLANTGNASQFVADSYYIKQQFLVQVPMSPLPVQGVKYDPQNHSYTTEWNTKQAQVLKQLFAPQQNTSNQGQLTQSSQSQSSASQLQTSFQGLNLTSPKTTTSPYPLKYTGKLPTIGTQPLDSDGYKKLKELHKTISSKLPIESILDRFASWASANQISFTDHGFKIALGTILPDAYIKHYDPLANDDTVPYHHLAYVLSKKLGVRKLFKVARSLGDDLANNTTDPPLKVLDDIECLYNNVDETDRKRLNEEAFLLAETFLTRRFGEKFWSIFSARLQAESVDTIADLTILFKTYYQKLAQSFEDEKTTSKKQQIRIHNLEKDLSLHDEVKENMREIRSILSHLDSPTAQSRAMDPQQTTYPQPSTVNPSVNHASHTLVGSCCSAHHVNPAPNPAQAPVYVPIIVPSGPNQQPQGNIRSNQNYQRQPNNNPGSRRFNVPSDRQYRTQACNISGHHNHRNQDCHIQMQTDCTYDPRHYNHKASECMRSRDHVFGACKSISGTNAKPIQSHNHNGNSQPFGPRARLQNPPQQIQSRVPNANRVNAILNVIESRLPNPTA